MDKLNRIKVNLTDAHYAEGSQLLARLIASDPDNLLSEGSLGYFLSEIAYGLLPPQNLRLVLKEAMEYWCRGLAEEQEYGSVEAFNTCLASISRRDDILTQDEWQTVDDIFAKSFRVRLANASPMITKDLRYRDIWLPYYNALLYTSESVPAIWDSWWNLNDRGSCVAVIMYTSVLGYDWDENPVMHSEGRTIWEYFEPWEANLMPLTKLNLLLKNNIEYVGNRLDYSFLVGKLSASARLLGDGEEGDLADKMLTGLPERKSMINANINTMLTRLATGRFGASDDDNGSFQSAEIRVPET